MNRMTLIGRLGKDPSIRDTAAGLVAQFSVATNDYWTDSSGQQKQHTEWHQVVCFDGLAVLARDYLRKGFEVYIEGPTRTSTWTDGENRKRTQKEIRVEALRMLRAPRRDADVIAILQSIEQLTRDMHSGRRPDCTLDDLAAMIATAREALADASEARSS